MVCKKMVEIDGDKLHLELAKREISKTGAAEKIGKSESYFSTVCKRERLTESSAKLIDAILGIPLELYVKCKQDPVKKEDNDFSYNKIYEVVYAAVYHAVKAAFKD